MIPIRFRRLRVAVAVTAALAVAGPTAAVPAQAAQTTASQVVGFTVGPDGRLYLASSQGVNPVSTAIAPPGAGVSAARQPDGNVAAFTIGTQGGLVAAVTSSATSNVSIYRDGPAGLAPPGGRVNAVSAPNGYVHVFFVGTDGAVYSASYNRVVRPTGGPRRVSATGLAPPGAVVAAAWQSTQAGVVLVGVDGGLHAVWQTGTGAWTTVPASPPGVASPGGGVAAVSTVGVQAYFSGSDGRLWQVGFAAAGPRPEPWAPVAISGAGVVPSGARLAAARFTNGPATVQFVGADGAVRMVTNQTGSWQHSATTPAGVARPGHPLAAVAVDDLLYSAWCGNDLWWWLFWWWRRPPPPPPWWGETVTFPIVNPIQYGYDISLTLYR